MQLLSLLNDVDFPLLQDGFYIDLGWLGQFIRILIESAGVIGLGIIVFTLILRAIVLPIDIFQRIKMRKQSLIMKQMKPELEKLQQQYKNDNQTYSRKMMELYKKNGYSIFGACLPMIVSMVILIVAITSLNNYSQYANCTVYEKMTAAYNSAVLTYSLDEEDDPTLIDITEETKDGNTFVVVKGKAADKFIYYRYNKNATEPVREYRIDTAKLYAYAGEEIDALLAELQKTTPTATTEDACRQYVRDIGSTAAAQQYRNDPPSFLWIKNIWIPDVSYNHPIQDYNSFVSSIRNNVTIEKVVYQENEETGEMEEVVVKEQKSMSEIVDQGIYESITAKLDDEKAAPNGYFVLVVLSIGLMFLQQFITMRSQKETTQFGSVDGSGKRQQKMMLIIFPLIYAFFAFMYSAAFSIYMVVSSIIGILVTVLSNLIIGHIFNKKEEAEFVESKTRRAPVNNYRDEKRKK